MSGSQGRPQSCPAAAAVQPSRGGLQPRGGRVAAARTVAGVSLTRPRTRRRRRGVQGTRRYTRRLPRSPCPPTLHSHRRRGGGPVSRRARAHGRGEWGQSCGAGGGGVDGKGAERGGSRRQFGRAAPAATVRRGDPRTDGDGKGGGGGLVGVRGGRGVGGGAQGDAWGRNPRRIAGAPAGVGSGAQGGGGGEQNGTQSQARGWPCQVRAGGGGWEVNGDEGGRRVCPVGSPAAESDGRQRTDGRAGWPPRPAAGRFAAPPRRGSDRGRGCVPPARRAGGLAFPASPPTRRRCRAGDTAAPVSPAAQAAAAGGGGEEDKTPTPPPHQPA